jgi:hypothetical protein
VDGVTEAKRDQRHRVRRDPGGATSGSAAGWASGEAATRVASDPSATRINHH